MRAFEGCVKNWRQKQDIQLIIARHDLSIDLHAQTCEHVSRNCDNFSVDSDFGHRVERVCNQKNLLMGQILGIDLI